MRNLVVAALTAILTLSAGQAAEKNGALPPGRPAGIKQAQSSSDTALYIVGGGILIAAIALAASGGGSNSSSSTSSTSATSTNP
jgi:hypothetical protein